MLGVGAFARLAQVSVRTLHHYDTIGLLKPAQVDAHTGYRWYGVEQLARLQRILVLRDLGIPLARIQEIVDDDVSVAELRTMLEKRRAEVHEQLARVEAALEQLEYGRAPSRYDITVKSLPAARLACLSDVAAEFGPSLSAIFRRLYPALHRALASHGVTPTGPEVALYEDSGIDATPIRVIAALPVDDGDVDDLDVRTLAPVPRALTTIHRGSMARVSEGYEALMHWAGEHGEWLDGYSREIYLSAGGPPETWMTELQFVLARP